MGIFEVLSLVGGLSLFLFGMSIMGQALEKKAGSKLRVIIENVTCNKYLGLLTGLVVTAVIQSSSATTVMVVGFVNSGIMTLKESISVIMGANIGTTVTSWILSLAGISSSNVFLRLLKPSSFTPILAFVGVIFYVFLKDSKKKDIGLILLGFATLMFGMEQMTASVSGLKTVPEFQKLFISFQNPILGILVGAILTAIIQSSSASVGILQALASTGLVTYSAAVPIIMGQNIGTCVTALLSSIGTTTNARRASLVHLFFNIFGTIFFTIVFLIVKYIFSPAILLADADMLGIAIVHTAFNIGCTLLIFPMSGLLEKLVCTIVKDNKKEVDEVFIDERLMAAPAVAIEECKNKIMEMCNRSIGGLHKSLDMINNFTDEGKEFVVHEEEAIDKYEDKIGTYLVKLSAKELTTNESEEVGRYLKAITDLERISDHSLNICELADKLHDQRKKFSSDASEEMNVMINAIYEISTNTLQVFTKDDIEKAYDVEPLEQVVDDLERKIKELHVVRLQKGKCDFEIAFIFNDLLINMERVSDHCSNIAGLIIDKVNNNMDTHSNVDNAKDEWSGYAEKFEAYTAKYHIEH